MKPVSKFHLFYSLQYIRYAIILSVIPLVQALLQFDLDALFTAFWQDGLIFLGVICFSLLQWSASGYWYSGERILIQEGLLVCRQLSISKPMVAAIELRQPIHAKLFSACQVKIYYKYRSRPVSLWLYYSDARTMAQHLLPLNRQDAIFKAVGAERLSFAVLSANIITTSILAAVSAKRTTELFGQDLNQFALSNIKKMERIIAQVLPVGLAWITAFIFVLASIALLFSFLSTAGFMVGRNNGVIVAKGGWLIKTERRILSTALTSCDIRITPMGRILRRSVVFLHAGGFSGKDLPIMVCKKGHESQLQKLIPEFHISPFTVADFQNRSFLQFIWLPGSLFLFLLSLTSVSAWLIPKITPLLALPCFLCVIWLFVDIEGFFTETVKTAPNRSLELCYTKFFTRHRIFVLTNQVAFQFSYNPLLDVRNRCNFILRLPCKTKFYIRCIPKDLAKNLALIL